MRIRRLAECSLMLSLIIIGAYIKIPIPYVPFSLQFLFVTLAGQLLGAKYGAFVVCVYIIMGLLGIPVFASGGGVAYVLQPTFGYLIGFVFSAYVSGVITEKYYFKYYRYIANFSAIVCMYFFGVIYMYYLYKLYFNQNLEITEILYLGVVLQLPGDILLSIFGAKIATRISKVRI